MGVDRIPRNTSYGTHGSETVAYRTVDVEVMVNIYSRSVRRDRRHALDPHLLPRHAKNTAIFLQWTGHILANVMPVVRREPAIRAMVSELHAHTEHFQSIR
jgi:hypothetical protein